MPLTAASHFMEGHYSTVDFTQPATQARIPRHVRMHDDRRQRNGSQLGHRIPAERAVRNVLPSFRLLRDGRDHAPAHGLGRPVAHRPGWLAAQRNRGVGQRPELERYAEQPGRPRSIGATAARRPARSPAANGSFNVAGTHTYASGGSYPITVTITRAGSSAVATDYGRDHLDSDGRRRRRGARLASGCGILGRGRTPAGCRRQPSFQYGLDPEVHRRRSGRLHPVDALAGRGLGFHQSPRVRFRDRTGSERSLPRPAGGDEQRRHDVRARCDVHHQGGAAADPADARPDVQRRPGQRRRPGQDQRPVRPVDPAPPDPAERR